LSKLAANVKEWDVSLQRVTTFQQANREPLIQGGIARPYELLTNKGSDMELEGVVLNGVIVPDEAGTLPEGARVRISPIVEEQSLPFGVRFAPFKGAAAGLPADLAEQHDHYRLGTPKR
jgi:hypothetical protein